MAKIITVPNPLLRQKSKPVEKISARGGPASRWDKECLDLIKEVQQTVIQTEGVKGVGLSAIQIGIPKRVFIAYSQKSHKFLVFINPEIVWKSKRLVAGVSGANRLEGCLSVPGIWGKVLRHQVIKIRYQTPNGQTVTRRFRGFLGIICQHEYDHLEGVLFTDRVLQQKNKLYELKKDEKGKERLEEITL